MPSMGLSNEETEKKEFNSQDIRDTEEINAINLEEINFNETFASSSSSQKIGLSQNSDKSENWSDIFEDEPSSSKIQEEWDVLDGYDNGSSAMMISPRKNDPPNQCELICWISESCVIEYLQRKKIQRLFPWQAECLKSPGVFDKGENLVYSASTSAGKSLVAEILALKTVFERKKKVIIILPFISIVREKLNHLKKMLKGTKYRVGGFMGTHHSKGGLDLYDIAVCTNEKANGFINKLLIQNTLDVIGAVIVDEVHSIGEGKRGPLLELMLTKIMVACAQKSNLNIQLIAMSATLPNLDHLARWLKARMYVTEFRPVPLMEKLMIGRMIYLVDGTFQELEQIDKSKLSDEAEADIYLVIRSLIKRESVLLFLNDKKKLERLALKISCRIKFLCYGENKTATLIKETVNEKNVNNTLDLFRSCHIKMDRSLYNCISFGVGYHHGSLCYEHREIIEEAFKAGWIRVLLTTSTLAAGVNLPARLVIVHTPKFLGRIMDPLLYRQMIGRAGRMGIDDKGESILLCAMEEGEAGEKLATMPLQPVASMMFHPKPDQPYEPLAKAVLEAIVTKLASTDEEIDTFLRTSYFSISTNAESSSILVYRETAIDYLIKKDFVSRKTIAGVTYYEASHLGHGTIAGSFTPEDGLRLLDNLQIARKGLVLTSDLHLLYLIVPLSFVNDFTLDQPELLRLFSSWRVDMIPAHVQDFMGALSIEPPGIVSKLLKGGLTSEKDKKFIIALILEEFTKERSIEYIHEVYGVSRPLLQNLQNYAASFAGMVASFCDKLNWATLHLAINRLVSQLTFGVQPELLELMAINLLNSKLARALYDSGLDTVRKVANCSLIRLQSIITPTMEYNDSGRYEMWIESVKQSMTVDMLSEEIQSAARDYIFTQTGARVDWSAMEQNMPAPANKNGPIRKRKKANN